MPEGRQEWPGIHRDWKTWNPEVHILGLSLHNHLTQLLHGVHMRVMWKHYDNYEAVPFKHFSNMVLVSNKILHGLQYKHIKEVIFYLYKFKPH